MSTHTGHTISAHFTQTAVIAAVNAFVADSANDLKIRDLAFLAIVKQMATDAAGTDITLDLGTYASLQAYI